MQLNLFYVLLLLIGLNIRTYYLMIVDKRRAINDKWRIPEAKLLWGSAVFGSIGVVLGMFAPVNHKKNKPRFAYGAPLMLVIQGIVLYWLYGQLDKITYFEIPNF